MGNTLPIHLKKPTDYFTNIDEEKISYLRNNYKIIDVDYLHPTLVHSKIFADEAFTSKQKIVNDMLNYYLKHADKEIYQKTNYLCNEKEKICICNNHANDLRKIYDGINYKPDEKYISFIQY